MSAKKRSPTSTKSKPAPMNAETRRLVHGLTLTTWELEFAAQRATDPDEGHTAARLANLLGAIADAAKTDTLSELAAKVAPTILDVHPRTTSPKTRQRNHVEDLYERCLARTGPDSERAAMTDAVLEDAVGRRVTDLLFWIAAESAGLHVPALEDREWPRLHRRIVDMLTTRSKRESGASIVAATFRALGHKTQLGTRTRTRKTKARARVKNNSNRGGPVTE